MLALLLAAVSSVQQQPPPPSWMIADYSPGPWIVFIAGGQALSADADSILDHAREQMALFPDVPLALCAEGRAGSRREEAQRLGTVRRALAARGLRVRERALCWMGRDRSRPPGVMIVTAAE